MSTPTVVQTIPFKTMPKAMEYVTSTRARPAKRDEATGAMLYKTPANVVLRPRATPTGAVVEVLTNCTC